MGQGTRRSPRHFSCLLSRTYQTGCDGLEDWLSKQGVLAGSIGWASKESWPEALAEQAKSLGQKIGWASKESWLEALAKQVGSLNQIHWLSNEQVKSGWDYRRANGCCVPYHFWANEKRTCYGSTQKNRIFLVKIKRSKLVYAGDTQWKENLLRFHSKE